MEHHPNTERPCGGLYWLLLAMPVTVLLWFWLLGLFWFRVGIWIWLWLGRTMMEGVGGWRQRGRKKNQLKKILIGIITLGGTLVALPHIYHQKHYLLVAMPHRTYSTSLNWIAAHIYFVWSPELMHIGLVVFVVSRWISAFTHAH
jgi:hypothetical protein